MFNIQSMAPQETKLAFPTSSYSQLFVTHTCRVNLGYLNGFNSQNG